MNHFYQFKAGGRDLQGLEVLVERTVEASSYREALNLFLNNHWTTPTAPSYLKITKDRVVVPGRSS